MDMTFKGLLAGLIGAIPMNAVNLILYELDLTNIRLLDWASIIMTGSLPTNLFSIIYSLFVQILWSGALGIGLGYLYHFLLPLFTSKNYLIKGVLYSFMLGFIFRGVVVLFQVPELYKITTQTSIMNFSTTLLWGLTTSYILHRLVDSKS